MFEKLFWSFIRSRWSKYLAMGLLIFFIIVKAETWRPTIANPISPETVELIKEDEALFRHRDDVSHVVLTNYDINHYFLGSTSNDGSMKLWTIAKNSKIDPDSSVELVSIFAHQGKINDLWLDKERTHLFSVGDDSQVNEWSINNLLQSQTPQTLEHDPADVTAVALSHNENLLALGSSNGSISLHTVDIKDISKIQKIAELELHNVTVSTMIFSQDDRYLISIDTDSNIKLWDISNKSPKIIQEKKTDQESVNFLASDGLTYTNVNSLTGEIKIINILTNEVLKSFKVKPLGNDDKYVVDLSADKQWLAVGTLNTNKVNVWSLETVLQEPQTAEGNPAGVEGQQAVLLYSYNTDQNGVYDLTISEDKSFILSVANNDQTVKIWRASNQIVSTVRYNNPGLTNMATISPSKKRLVTCCGIKNSIELWDISNLRKPKLINPFYGHQDSVTELLFSSDSQTLITGSIDKSVKFWDLQETPDISTAFDDNNDSAVPISIALSPNQSLTAIGYGDGRIKIWKTKTHQLIATINAHDLEVTSLIFRDDGKELVSASKDGTIKIWTLKKEKGENAIQFLEVFKNYDAGSYIAKVAYTPNGLTLVSLHQRLSGGYDVKFWNANTHDFIKAITGEETVSDFAFSHNTNILATGNSNGTINLWDWRKSGTQGDDIDKPLFTLEGHPSAVTSLSFSPDDGILVSGSTDDTIKIWRVST